MTPLELRVFLQLDPEIPISAIKLAEKIQDFNEAIDDAWKVKASGRIKWPAYLRKTEDVEIFGGHIHVQISTLRKKLGQKSILTNKSFGYLLGSPETDLDPL